MSGCVCKRCATSRAETLQVGTSQPHDYSVGDHDGVSRKLFGLLVPCSLVLFCCLAFVAESVAKIIRQEKPPTPTAE